MITGLTPVSPRTALRMLLIAWMVWAPVPSAWSQSLQERAPRDPSFQEMLDFDEPTVIRGRVRMVDRDELAIWIIWEQRLEERSAFPQGWTQVQDGALLLLYARDHSQFQALDRLSTGTALELVVQLTDDKRRQILSFKNLEESTRLPFHPKGP